MAIAESLKKLQMKFVCRKDVTIAGNKYTLQVLSLREEQRVQSLPSEDVEGIAFFNEMQKSVLAHALRAVDGEEIPDIIELDDQDGKKVTKERPIYVREILDSLPSAILDNLFQVYADMRDEKEQEINSSLTYSWYKTPKQREEERKRKDEEDSSKKTEEAPATNEEAVVQQSDVPSPDAEIKLRMLPPDNSDVPGVSKE